MSSTFTAVSRTNFDNALQAKMWPSDYTTLADWLDAQKNGYLSAVFLCTASRQPTDVPDDVASSGTYSITISVFNKYGIAHICCTSDSVGDYVIRTGPSNERPIAKANWRKLIDSEDVLTLEETSASTTEGKVADATCIMNLVKSKLTVTKSGTTATVDISGLNYGQFTFCIHFSATARIVVNFLKAYSAGDIRYLSDNIGTTVTFASTNSAITITSSGLSSFSDGTYYAYCTGTKNYF